MYIHTYMNTCMHYYDGYKIEREKMSWFLFHLQTCYRTDGARIASDTVVADCLCQDEETSVVV